LAARREPKPFSRAQRVDGFPGGRGFFPSGGTTSAASAADPAKSGENGGGMYFAMAGSEISPKEQGMAAIAVAAPSSVGNCTWSRPGYRLSRVDERDQPEAKWVCVRTGERHDIDEMGCARCPNWERDPDTV
jgi:hypothetical protein